MVLLALASPTNADAASLLETPSSARTPQVAIPVLQNQQRGPARMRDGKMQVQRVKLSGTYLFPEYGVTREYLGAALNAVHAQQNEWMTIRDMNALADALTLAYHRKGLTFTQVHVVPNVVRNATLELNVLPGRVTEIALRNNRYFKDEIVKTPFLHLLGQVVYEPDIRSALDRANLSPGYRVFGFYSLGQYPGQTRLNLHVLEERKYTGGFRVDNYGVNSTGEIRLHGFYHRHNLTGRADQLSLLGAVNEMSGNVYGSVTYQRPLTKHAAWHAMLGNSAYELGGDFELIGLQGSLWWAGAGYRHELLKEDNATAVITTDAVFKDASGESEEFEDSFVEEAQYLLLNAQLAASALDLSGHWRQALNLGVTLGTLLSQSDNLDSDYVLKLNAGVGADYRWRPGNPVEQVTSLTVNATWSAQQLPRAERGLLTGPAHVRGYSAGLFSADSSLLITAEHVTRGFEGPLSTRLRPFAFIDYGIGWLQQNQDDIDASFIGAGVGLRAFWSRHLAASGTLGFPLADSRSDDLELSDQDPALYGQITWTF